MTKTQEIPDEIMREAHDLMDLICDENATYGESVMRIANALSRNRQDSDTAARKECAEIARYTYAKDAFHFELGTEIAAAIEATIGGRDAE